MFVSLAAYYFTVGMQNNLTSPEGQILWGYYDTYLGNKKHFKRRNDLQLLDLVADADFSVYQATQVFSKQIKQTNKKQIVKALWERVPGLWSLFIFSSEFSFVLVFSLCSH